MHRSSMITVYTGAFLPHITTDLALLYPNIGMISRKKRLFLDEAVSLIKEPMFEIVQDPAAAQFFLLPYNYYQVEREVAYLKAFEVLAHEHGKNIVVFDYSDYDRPVVFQHAIVFRNSQYRSALRSGEYLVPPLVEDLSLRSGITLRHKGEKAVVGFCGWASISGFIPTLKFVLKSMFLVGPRKQGIYWRKHAIEVLKRSHLVVSNFILRNSFSAHTGTIALDPVIAREEYIQNIQESDFVLAPKGDGNYSMRFYEALSLGRIPVLLNTDTPLPFEDVVPYEEFSINVSYTQIEKLPEIIKDFYENISDDQFTAIQKKAREYFERYFRPDASAKQIERILQKR